MKIAELVKNRIDRFPEGYIFTYDDINIDVKSESVLKVALYRLVKSGKIERLSKGRFYKPKEGIVGNLKPDEYEVVKDLLKDGSNIIGYITGYSVFNSFKLTTQVPNIIQVGVNFDKKEIKRDIYKIKFVRQKNKITKTNIPLLQLLDCVRFIKAIPDTTISDSIKRIKILINELSDSEKTYLSELAVNYSPSAKALTGAILEQLGYNELANKLFKTLKSTTWYKFNIEDDLLPNKQKWRIQ
ncbi:MAG: DUF6088 family protein [Bacteroidales bacterium]